MPTWDVIEGDCRAVMPGMDAEIADSLVTDPPYGLGFMGKDWDHGVPGEHFWVEALRVAKPGAHLLAFGGTRTHHRLMCAIEDAGWEIRDTLMWIFGAGFPKSLDVSKAIDREAGAERRVVGQRPISYPDSDCWGTPNSNSDATCHNPTSFKRRGNVENGTRPVTAPSTPAAHQWQGWGTALKPAYEPIVLARKPIRGTVAANVQACGCGALNIDASRIGTSKDVPNGTASGSMGGDNIGYGGFGPQDAASSGCNPNIGRWPANLLLDESAAAMLDEAVGESTSGNPRDDRGVGGIWSHGNGVPAGPQYGDTGGPSRFFARFHYSGKATSSDRNEGCDGSNHPCVKPTDLMRWLVKLITPPGGTVLDPFTGSGSTGKACAIEGFDFIGIELDPEYVATARARIAEASNHLFAKVPPKPHIWISPRLDEMESGNVH